MTKCEWQPLPLSSCSLFPITRLFCSIYISLCLFPRVITSLHNAPSANFRIFMHVLTCSSIVGVTSRCQACNVLWSIYVCLRIYYTVIYVYTYICICGAYMYIHTYRDLIAVHAVGGTFCLRLAGFCFHFPLRILHFAFV